MQNTANKLTAVVMAVALLFTCFIFPVYAEEEANDPMGGSQTEGTPEGDEGTEPEEDTFPKSGEVFDLSTNLRVRTGPGTTHTRLTNGGENVNLYNGHIVNVLEEVPSDDNSAGDYAVWYKVKFSYSGVELEGYIPAVFVKIKEQTGEITQDFEEMIAPFPEDYKEALRQLHLYYPQWKFIPMQIDMDWNYVINREAEPQRNYVNSSAPESHRSTLAGSYDWTTDTWVTYGSKYDASKEIISYYMDPRNFLDEKYIFQFESLSYDPAVHTLEGVEHMISKVNFMNGKVIKNENGEEISYAQAYMDAALKTNVSPYHLVARTRQEVGVNGSASVSGTESGYKGIYNFYNIHANTSWKDGLEWAADSGDWGRPWNSQYKSIVNGADWIGSGYINKGQNTLYFEKFAVVGNGLFWHQYMQTITAPYSEASTIYNAYKEMDMLSSALSFIIPVYKNMPAENCIKPTATGSPNNWLKELSVEGYNLTPTFECNGKTEYSLIVDNAVQSVNIKATAVSSGAKIAEGNNRTVPLNVGTNTVNITVTAGNGDKKTYVLTVIRGSETGEDPPPPPVTPPEPDSGYETSYNIQNGKISGIAEGTTLNEIKANLGLTGNATVQFQKSTGAVITDLNTKAATGMTVTITAGEADVFTILIYGDTNGDGSTDAIDLLMVRRSLLGQYSLTGVYYSAGDCNKDGEVDAIDLLMIRRHILKTFTIEQ